MEERDDGRLISAAAGIAVQLALSYAVAGGAAVTLILVVGARPVSVAAAVVAAVGLGLLGSASLWRNLHLIDLVISRLARGLPTELALPGVQWPLRATLESIEALIRLLDDQARRERETNAYHTQLLEKVGASAAQEERNRLARELHDSIKQQIFSMSMSAAAAEARWENDPSGARAAMADVQRSAQEALVEMRALLQELRPGALEGVGLREAVQTQCEALGYRTGATVALERCDLPPEDRVPPAAQEALFRIVQEALSNIARHARARNVTVGLGWQTDDISLWVRDDGRGFDVARPFGGSGIAGMRERAQSLGGNLDVESVPGKGTVVQVHIPLYRPRLMQRDDEEVARAREERRGAIKLGTLVEQITVLLMFLDAPIPAVLLGLAVASFSYLRARYFAAQLTVRPGASTVEDGEHTYQEYGLLAGALGIAGLSVLYLFVIVPGWHLQAWQVVAPALAVEALGAIATVFWLRGINRYLSRLAGSERQRAAGRRLGAIRASIVVWSIVLVIGLLFGFTTRFPPHTLNQWADDASLGILAIWPLVDAADYLLSSRWRRRLRRARE